MIPELFVAIVGVFQVPVIVGILDEDVGNASGVVPWHKAEIGLKVVVSGAITVMSIVVGKAHSPGFGVNEYVVIPIMELSIKDGLQVPAIEMESTEFKDRIGEGELWHKLGMLSKAGVNLVIT